MKYFLPEVNWYSSLQYALETQRSPLKKKQKSDLFQQHRAALNNLLSQLYVMLSNKPEKQVKCKQGTHLQ